MPQQQMAPPQWGQQQQQQPQQQQAPQQSQAGPDCSLQLDIGMYEGCDNAAQPGDVRSIIVTKGLSW